VTGRSGSRLPRALSALLVLLAPACTLLETHETPLLPLDGNRYEILRGASFELPADWSLKRSDGLLLLEDPDRELRLWMTDIEGGTGLEAIALAWQRAVPGFARRIDDIASPPAAQGWDSITEVSYEAAAEESRALGAVSRDKDGIAYVMLLDGSLPALQRRGAQLARIAGSLRAPGFEPESVAGKQAGKLDEALAASLDAFIEEARKASRIPGAAVVVVQGGATVFERGYGTRRSGADLPVTPETAFMIGSVTKPLTSLMMAVLAERGLFDWSTPIRDVLPGFSVASPELTGRIEMRHGVCGCTGLPRQDMELLFEFAGVSPEARLAQLAAMQPTTGFGETFQYSNALVSAGGFAAAHALRPRAALAEAYEQAMRETLFEPMGMASTTFSARAATRANHARPHGLDARGEYVELPLSYEGFVDAIAPAGAAWSNTGDLARYLRLELSRGRLPDGTALISEAGLLERRKPWMRIGPDSAYGLALVVSDAGGLRSVGHNGGTFGFSAAMLFWPGHDLGLAVLTNAQSGHAFINAVGKKLLELALGIDLGAGRMLEHRLKRRDESAARELARMTLPPDPSWIAPLLGAYENAALGKLAVRAQGDSYVVDVGEWKSEIARHDEAGQSTLVLVGPPFARLKLQPREGGDLLLDAGQQKYVFRRDTHAE
jgi:CubicO group peptidase (beta-lactamase class C family)